MSRMDLKTRLEELLKNDGITLYFQPPANMKMKYPCIVYEVSDVEINFANDSSYVNYVSYQLMLITKSPDEQITAKLLKNVPFIRFDRTYISNNLYHYVFACYEKMI